MKNRLKKYFDQEEPQAPAQSEPLELIKKHNRLVRLIEELREENIWLVRELANYREQELAGSSESIESELL